MRYEHRATSNEQNKNVKLITYNSELRIKLIAPALVGSLLIAAV